MNAGGNFSRGRYFASLSISFVDGAFWTDVLDARYYGRTPPYTLLNAGFGVRSTDGTMTVRVGATNLLNATTQQHIFGDLIGRTFTGEVRFSL
jgi:hypothetical protein